MDVNAYLAYRAQQREVIPGKVKTPYGLATQIPVQTFLNTFLPPLHAQIDLDKIIKRETRGHKYKLLTKEGRLWGFGRRRPSETGSNEIYKQLQVVASKLGRIHSKLRRRFMLCHGNLRNGGDDRSRFDNTPDGYFVPYSKTKGQVDWFTVAVSAVYSHVAGDYTTEDVCIFPFRDNHLLRYSPQIQNVRILMHCMALCIQRDARRRFTYGFAVEDNKMTLWYCDRRQIIASEPFDFIKVSLCLIVMSGHSNTLAELPPFVPLPSVVYVCGLSRIRVRSDRDYR